MRTSRRAFLRLFVGSAVIATIPIPKFLFPESKYPKLFEVDQKLFETWHETHLCSGTTLTVEMIEEAAKRSCENMGRPDMLLMSKPAYKKLAKHFGYKVVYSGDEIFTWKL